MSTEATSDNIELTVFTVGDILCAVENDKVREISGLRSITPVHHAPSHVRGVVNLRGQIMTIIDLGVRLGIGPVPDDRRSRILVVRSGEEDIGLLVDGIEDVKTVSASDMEAPPSNVQGVSGAFLKAILKEKDDLACIVDMEKILHTE